MLEVCNLESESIGVPGVDGNIVRKQPISKRVEEKRGLFNVCVAFGLGPNTRSNARFTTFGGGIMAAACVVVRTGLVW